jgi:hypothetical protein
MMIASAISPTRPASPSDLTSAIMFVTTSPKNGRFVPTRSVATIASANSKNPTSVSALIQFLTVPNMGVSPFKFYEQSASSQLKHQGRQVALRLKSGDNSFDRLPGLGRLSFDATSENELRRGGSIMTKRKKGSKVQSRAKLRRAKSAKRGKARKIAKAVRRTVARAKPKPAPVKKAAQRTKQPVVAAVEIVAAEVIEQPTQGVITVTEVEETVRRVS